jgi:PD-(D/E)XK endonuclease
MQNHADPQPQPSVTINASVGNPDRKRRGEASEAEFIARASGFGFSVAKPWGESDSYDVLVGSGHGFWRVQVKCATYHHRRQFLVKAGGDAGHYTADDIDFLAGHVVPENVWYIVPIDAFAGRTMLHFCPLTTGKAKYEKYREAWCLLACPPKARGWKDIPVLCRCKELPARCTVCPRK